MAVIVELRIPRLQSWECQSHPIDVQNAPPTYEVVNAAHIGFRAARGAFRGEDFPRALRLTEESLKLVPDDPIVHQFRALSLFALRRYDEAAAATYAVLAVEPGWDWTTMASLYDNLEAYTRQLRLLEDYAEAHPGSAEARFLLAYHYLGAGYVNQAVGEWKRVLALRPNDLLSARMIQALQPSRSSEGEELTAHPTIADTPATSAAPGSSKPADLTGTWAARPIPGTTITLSFQPEGQVVCKIRQAGRDREFAGYAIRERATLTLTQDQDNSLVGTLSWQDQDHFNFRLLARWPGDRGLTFTGSH
jgi:tetratricopeptide (TPR) repeat protein